MIAKGISLGQGLQLQDGTRTPPLFAAFWHGNKVFADGHTYVPMPGHADKARLFFASGRYTGPNVSGDEPVFFRNKIGPSIMMVLTAGRLQTPTPKSLQDEEVKLEIDQIGQGHIVLAEPLPGYCNVAPGVTCSITIVIPWQFGRNCHYEQRTWRVRILSACPGTLPVAVALE